MAYRIRIACLATLTLGPIWGQELVLPRARVFSSAAPRSDRVAAPAALSGREAVVRWYQTQYLATVPPAEWTGNRSNCDPGATSEAYAAATLQRLNSLRILAGLNGDLTLSPAWNAQCQAAALMMSVQRQLSHTPAPGWACYTDAGAEAAAHANLALGLEGPAAIDFYFDDPGTGNAAVGHRRWLLYPPTQRVGVGSVPAVGGFAANAVWVVGGQGDRPAEPRWVAWPPAGYVPYRLLPAISKRWSFSMPQASFAGATVSMFRDGVAVPVTLEPQSEGYADNTLVWLPQGVPVTAPGDDITYSIIISNVVGDDGPQTYAYDVTIIDPLRVVPSPVLAARIQGDALVLSWPGSFSGYRVQRADSLSEGRRWDDVPGVPQLVANSWALSVERGLPRSFYRLSR